MRVPATGIKFDVILGYSAHRRILTQARRLLDIECGQNWFVARIGSLALKVWR